MKVAIITLGCKVNKYESDCIARMLEENNIETCEDVVKADFYIINTCAVTNEAEKKSRQHVAKITKIDPKAKIIVCGCASESDKEKFLTKQNVVAVMPHGRKDLIVNYILQNEFDPSVLPVFNDKLVNPKITQTRAYIKIQDGCNRFCSYCIIPYLRGRSVSRDMDSIVIEAEELSKHYNEIVLVGIDMSDYKVNGKLALTDLMIKLSKVNARIRLGSLEESVITEDFLKALQGLHDFAPQFHLSLQSGDDFVLKKMNRKYTSQNYIDACNLIYKYFPDANITTDIIVGFPYEEEDNFNNTLLLAEKVKFGKIHCFPFSAKKGTIAYRYKDVDPATKKDRMNRLTQLANKLSYEYNARFVGKTLEMLIEEVEDNYYVGYSGNYIKCYLGLDANINIGDITKVKVIELYNEGVKVKRYE